MKKKVMIIIPSLRIGGGAERVASSLTKELSERYYIYIITFYDYKSLYPYEGKYYSFKENLHFGRLIFRIFYIYNKIRKISPDIIISFLDYTSIFTIFTKILFHIKIPLIISVRSNPNLRYKGKLSYYKFLIKLLYPLKIINAVVPVTKEIKTILMKNFNIDKNKIYPIYNGTEIEKIKQKAKDKIEDNKNIFCNKQLIKFITVGTLKDVKAYDYLIIVFSSVIKIIPNSKLIIIGEGPLRNKLENLIEKYSLKNDVYLIGKKKNPFKYLARSDIFVLTSKYEGFPNVIIEAMACNLPIISTNCKTGPKEILGNGKFGILVNPLDFEELKKKMIFLAQDKSSREYFSKKSLDRVKAFDFTKISDDWINLIESYL